MSGSMVLEDQNPPKLVVSKSPSEHVLPAPHFLPITSLPSDDTEKDAIVARRKFYSTLPTGSLAPMFGKVCAGGDGDHDGDRHCPELGSGLRKGCTTTSTVTEPAFSNFKIPL